MANITERKDKDGNVTSYRIRVMRGYDGQGRKLKPYEMTYKPDKGMTKRQIEKELQRQATLFEEECKKGNISNVPNLKLRDFCDTYFDIKKDVLSPRTFENYKSICDSLIIPQLGHLKVTDLQPAHIQAFIQRLNNDSDKVVSPSTIKRKLAVLQSILRQAVKLGLIQSNPADAERLTLPKQITPKVEIFTRQEAIEMLQCLEYEPLQYKAIVYIALYSGARQGEIVALKFSDVDFINNKITISRSAYKIAGKPVATKSPKDNDVRTVTIDAYTIELIRQLKSEKECERLRLGTAWKGDEWIFTAEDGSPMFPSTPSHWFRKFLARHGLKHRKFHALRHTSATLLLLGGLNIKQVSSRLGHADLRVTNLYVHNLQEADVAAPCIIHNLLKTQSSNGEEQEGDKLEQTG